MRLTSIFCVILCCCLAVFDHARAASGPTTTVTAPAAPSPSQAPPPAPGELPEQAPDEAQREQALEHVRKEAEATAEQLRQAAEAAQVAAQEARRSNVVWDEVFRQSVTELKSVEVEADSLAAELSSLIRPLRASLPEMEEGARRLLALSETQRAEPLMLETIHRRGESLAASLRQQMRPLAEARELVKELTNTVEQTKRNLPEGSEGAGTQAAGTEEQVRHLKDKLSMMADRLDRPLERSTRLLERLTAMSDDIMAQLPKIWMDYYLAVPSRFFDPTAWQNMDSRVTKSMQNMLLRLSVEVPRSAPAWQGFALRGLNMLLLGGALVFFINVRLRRMHQSRLGDEPEQARRGIIRNLCWVLAGLAVLGAAIGNRGEVYRAMLLCGSLIAMWGEVALAWDMRCLTLNRQPGPSPLRPFYFVPAVGILLSFPNVPNAVLSLCWLGIGLGALWLSRNVAQRSPLPAVEDKLFHVHRLTLWLSLAVAAFGWSRMAILLVVVMDCLLVSIELCVGLMQLINRSADTGSSVVAVDEHARRSITSGLFAAFTAPIVLALVTVGMTLWVIAMPGGALLLWHYLATGVSIGSVSFNVLHLLLIISLFYITRAAITALQSLLDRLAANSSLSSNLASPMRTGITYGLWILFGLFTLQALGFSLESLAVIAGGLSVGIGFGLQNIVNNFLSGLILIFSRILHEGDIIDVGNLQGIVRKINVRATMIETFDNAVIFVPNSEFVSNRLINWTRNGRTVRREVSVGVAYGSDPARVEALLIDIARRTPKVLAWPQPYVVFANFGNSTLDFMLRFWADINDAMAIASAIRKDITRTFAEQNINIAFPQLDVHLIRDTPEKPVTNAPAPSES